MQRNVMWSPVDAPGLEHLRLTVEASEITADGEIITTQFGNRPLRIDYWVQCDAQWRVRQLRVSTEGIEPLAVILTSDGAGHWVDEQGNARSDLDGCIDVDIMATPFTNTLPIRRLPWKPGQSADLTVAYVTLPTLEVVPAPQRYTSLETGPNGGRFRYESLSSGYTNELPVDGDGLVLDYPGIWRRVWQDGTVR
jgi:hypothetical protein